MIVGAEAERPAHEHPRARQPAGREDVVRLQAEPGRRQAIDAVAVRLPRQRDGVERADRAADDQVGGDAAVDHRPQHPDLDGAQVPAEAQHEGRLRLPAPRAQLRDRHGPSLHGRPMSAPVQPVPCDPACE